MLVKGGERHSRPILGIPGSLNQDGVLFRRGIWDRQIHYCFRVQTSGNRQVVGQMPANRTLSVRGHFPDAAFVGLTVDTTRFRRAPQWN